VVSFFDDVDVDSKGGSWRHAGGMSQPTWLFRRKASPFVVAKKHLLSQVLFSGLFSKKMVYFSYKMHLGGFV